MKNKIIAILSVITAFSLSACSAATGQPDGKSGIIRDETQRAVEDNDTMADEPPATYIQDPEYADEGDIISTDENVTISGVSYKIDSYEHTTQFGNRSKDTVADFLKDLYGDAIDDNYNLSNGNSYIFLTLTITNNNAEEIDISRNAGMLCAIKDDMEMVQESADAVYIDKYWNGGQENEVYHYRLKAGESVTSEIGYIITDEYMPENSKNIYYEIKGIDDETNNMIQKYFKLEI